MTSFAIYCDWLLDHGQPVAFAIEDDAAVLPNEPRGDGEAYSPAVGDDGDGRGDGPSDHGGDGSGTGSYSGAGTRAGDGQGGGTVGADGFFLADDEDGNGESRWDYRAQPRTRYRTIVTGDESRVTGLRGSWLYGRY